METYKINMKISGAPSVIGRLIKDIEEYGPAGHFAADCKAEIEKSSGAKRDMVKNGRDRLDRLNVKCTATFEKV